MKIIIAFALISALIGIPHASAQTTTIAQIVSEIDTKTPDPKKPKYCSGGVFKPCVCWKDVTKRVMYRPSVKECRGGSAIILTGSYAGAFSAVLRNIENADRIPVPSKATVNGCSKELASSESPPNRCSLFKAQKVIRVSNDGDDVTVHCMGARGNSFYGRQARRITIKLADRPNDSSDPLVRVCLKSPLENLN